MVIGRSNVVRREQSGRLWSPSAAGGGAASRTGSRVIANTSARPVPWPGRPGGDSVGDGSKQASGAQAVGLALTAFGVGKGARPRRKGRAESVPEAGGTGAEAVATPTPPPAGHDAESRANATASTDDDRWSAGEHPATTAWGMFGPRGSGRTPQPRRGRSGGSSGGIEGGGAPNDKDELRNPCMVPWISLAATERAGGFEGGRRPSLASSTGAAGEARVARGVC